MQISTVTKESISYGMEYDQQAANRSKLPADSNYKLEQNTNIR